MEYFRSFWANGHTLGSTFRSCYLCWFFEHSKCVFLLRRKKEADIVIEAHIFVPHQDSLWFNMQSVRFSFILHSKTKCSEYQLLRTTISWWHS